MLQIRVIRPIHGNSCSLDQDSLKTVLHVVPIELVPKSGLEYHGNDELKRLQGRGAASDLRRRKPLPTSFSTAHAQSEREMSKKYTPSVRK